MTDFDALPQWKRDAIARSALGRFAEFRADTAIAHARADAAEEAAHEAHQVLQATKLAAGVDVIARRLDAYETRAKTDAAAEQQRVQQMLDALPDPDKPDPFALSGDLHSVPPSALQHEARLAAMTDQGALPRDLEEGAPPELGTEPSVDDPLHNIVSPPVAAGLD